MCPIIILYNNLSVNPGVFLTKKCPLKKSTKCDPKDIGQFLRGELSLRDSDFSRKLDVSYIKLVNWIIKMNSDIMLDKKINKGDSTHNQIEFLKQRAGLITFGLDLATEIKRSTKQLILMY